MWAQQAATPGGASAYQGVSVPPADPIMASPDNPAAIAKPSAAVPMALADQAAQSAAQDAGSAQGAVPNYPPSGYQPPASQQAGDAYAPAQLPAQSRLYSRTEMPDPDGDMVHPLPPRPGELVEGSTIRVRLLDRLSSSDSEKGEPFHGQVASDVYQNGKVLIPAGSGIEGRVSAVSSGHFAGHGSLRLKPETIILPDGTRFQIHAETTGTPGSNTRIGGEGAITPGSRAKRDAIEYGSVVGTGVVAGAVVGGPVGALTGGLIGAGVVTTHLMVSHPQATLEPGSVILFTLTESIDLTPQQN
jgi:hypothetical protein